MQGWVVSDHLVQNSMSLPPDRGITVSLAPYVTPNPSSISAIELHCVTASS